MTSYIKSKKIFPTKQNQGLAVLSILVILAIFCLGFFYIIQTNGLVKSSYQIRQQEEYLRELEVESQQLETEIANWQSPANLEELIKSLNLIEGGEAIYLGEETAVAVKE
jgi:cell division protein FtsB